MSLLLPAPAGTFTDLVRERAADDPDRAAFSFVHRHGGDRDRLSRAGLDARARSVAAHLQDRGLTGERVLVLLAPGLDYIAAFLGCLYAGATAVPLYPPPRVRHSARHAAVLADAGAAAVLADEDGASIAPYLTGDRAAQLISPTDPMPDADAWRRPEIGSDTVAFLQYTSGSTGSPKGVMVTHGNLLANSREIQRTFGTGPHDHAVSWLPPYHDMGLIGGILQPLYAGCTATLMSPFSFVTSPRMWLELMSREGARVGGGPNFAYDLCVDRLSDADLEGLDLSRWEVAFNGAEPVRAETLDRFAAKMAPTGFRRQAFFPCYGLAEATLLVSGRSLGETAPVAFDADSLAPGSVPAPRPGGTEVVSCGPPSDGVSVAVVDPATGVECAHGQVGEITVGGAGVAAGYWNRADATAETFPAPARPGAPALRTGDLGFLYGGDLHVVGRGKDLVVVRGRNHYPSDLEHTAAESHPLVRRGGAAFARAGAHGEEAVLVLETSRPRDGEEYADVVTAVLAALGREHGLTPGAVVLVRPGSVPRTSSGKVQRSHCRELLAVGGLRTVHHWEGGQQASADAPEQGEDLRTAVLRLASDRLGRPVDPAAALVGQGMDSLAALQFKAAVAEELGVDLSLEVLLGGACPDDIVRGLGDAPAAPGPRARTLEGAGTDPDPHAPLPLTSGQRALWYLEQQNPGTAPHISVALRLRAPLPPQVLRRALDTLVERHPALRTAFRTADGVPFQQVAATATADFTVADASALDEAGLRDLAAREIAGTAFDLSAGRLLRALLLTHPGGSVLCLVVHHIVADMWSLTLLAEELGALCGADGDAAALPAPRRPHAALMRRHAAAGERHGEELWEHWRDVLDGCDPVLELPADRPRPARQSFDGDSVSFALEAATVDALRDLAAREGTTLFTVLLGVFQTLVHRYTGRDDFLVGVPTSGRTDPATHGSVGYFVNPVLIRSRVDADRDFLGQVRAAGAAVTDALHHQDMPFPALVERLRLARDASRAPGYQVLFSLTSPHRGRDTGLGALQTGRGGAGIRVGGLDAESLPLTHRTTLVDLNMVLTETGDGVEGMIDYASALFDRATMDRFALHFRTLAAAFAADPATPVGEARLLSDEELGLLKRWNDTGSPYPRDETLAALFARQADRTPDAPALVHGEVRLSYRGLDRAAELLAGRLRALGIGTGDLVALHMDRHPGVVLAALAVVKTGAAYVPLDPGHPAERRRRVLAEAAVSAVLTAGGDAPSAADGTTGAGAGVPVLEVASLLDPAATAEPAAEPSTAPAAAGPDDLAYVMYTSGSTGVPKGIGITHRNITRLVLGTRYVSFAAGDRVAQLSNAAFDAATFEIWGALLNGGTLIGLDRDSVLTPARLAGALRDHHVDTAVMTTSLFNQLAAHDPKIFAPLRQLLVGGDVLDVHAAARVTALDGGPRLINGYGPTESATFATAHTVGSGPAPAGTRLPIGTPIENTTVHVLDDRLSPCPVGVPGRIHIGGDGLGRGYLGRPDLTAERFLPDPFADAPGARMYDTGDLGRRLPDGSVDFLGRADFQVKIRGFRVEPGETDAALLRHPRVAESVTVVHGEAAAKRLVCYYAGDDAPAPQEAAAHLRALLPEYLVPAAFVRLDRLPLTGNGKVDRAALPAPHRGAPRTSPTEPAGTPLEREVAELFAELLGVPRVGATQNFFLLGGHSLLAMQLLVRVRERYGVDLPIAELFDDPTVRAVAARLERNTAAPAPATRGPARLARRAYVAGSAVTR
ncbi:non-ribosomal peptide synthetase [Streptomyces sp. MAR25Y5]|uniref:non-ribosomal peptide synthetase n=1 Tax=Streptomyces sp. MAR25Y5 TaxID=2962028 RepID=UPI0020B7BE03|nr:non-ribosomal peptide synthetase [Streptomyces sp. MAR25Y5]MCP3771084.1 amino acid adenylation domain-containing protein [Streptomyces sp. MAR25Y5]